MMGASAGFNLIGSGSGWDEQTLPTLGLAALARLEARLFLDGVAELVLRFADGVLHRASGLFDDTLGFKFFVARSLADRFLRAADDFLGRAVNSVIAHCIFLFA